MVSAGDADGFDEGEIHRAWRGREMSQEGPVISAEYIYRSLNSDLTHIGHL
jgi:hypothetical protein